MAALGAERDRLWDDYSAANEQAAAELVTIRNLIDDAMSSGPANV